MAALYLFSTDLGSHDNTHELLFRVIGIFWPGVEGLSDEGRQLIEFWVRKSTHLVGYWILGVLLARAFSGSGFSLRPSVIRAWLLLVSYAALDELHQSYVPTRTSSPIDVGIDMIGGAAGIITYAYYLYRRRKARHRERSEAAPLR